MNMIGRLVMAAGAGVLSTCLTETALGDNTVAATKAERMLDSAREESVEQTRAAIRRNLEEREEETWAATLRWMEKWRRTLGTVELEWG